MLLETLHKHAVAQGIPLRTREQVLDTLKRCAKQKSDISMARLMLKAGRMTDDARAAIQEYVSAKVTAK